MTKHYLAPAPASTKIQPKVLEVLNDEWTSSSTVCVMLGTYTGNDAVRGALNLLTKDGVIERMASTSKRGGLCYLYRRAATCESRSTPQTC